MSRSEESFFDKKPKALPIQGSKLIYPKGLTNIGQSRHNEEREKKGELAQLVEHYNGIVGVSGSSPLFSINKSNIRRETALPYPHRGVS